MSARLGWGLANVELDQQLVTLTDEFEALEAFTRGESELHEFAALLADFETTDGDQIPRLREEVSQRDIELLLSDFEHQWRAELEENAGSAPLVNIWTVADLGLDEVRNCKVLKWLLDPNETHCQGIRFLNCFLQAIGEPPCTDSEQQISVRREVTISEGDSRIDITIESSSVLLWIEAKIRADEDSEQLERYFERAKNRLRGRRFIGKLLAENGNKGEAIAKGFTRLLWSDIATALRHFGADCETDPFVARDQFVRRLATQYADFIVSRFGRKVSLL